MRAVPAWKWAVAVRWSPINPATPTSSTPRATTSTNCRSPILWTACETNASRNTARLNRGVWPFRSATRLARRSKVARSLYCELEKTCCVGGGCPSRRHRIYDGGHAPAAQGRGRGHIYVESGEWLPWVGQPFLRRHQTNPLGRSSGGSARGWREDLYPNCG